jgi:four helix bundle protein
MAVQTFKDLVAWQESMHLVEEVYAVCTTLPKSERFGLEAQIKRAVVSIPSNIGEGARRRRRLTFRYHLEVALGSQAEVEVQVEIARRVGFVDEATYRRIQERIERVGRLLNGLIDSLERLES